MDRNIRSDLFYRSFSQLKPRLILEYSPSGIFSVPNSVTVDRLDLLRVVTVHYTVDITPFTRKMSPQGSTEALLAYMTETNNKSSDKKRNWRPWDYKAYDHDRHYSEARILDALANICIFDPDNESIAVALRRISQNGLEIFIAADQDIPLKTITHIEGVWRRLQLLSEVNSKIASTKPTGDPRIDNVPKLILRVRKRTIGASIWRECLKFSWKIFQKQLN